MEKEEKMKEERSRRLSGGMEKKEKEERSEASSRPHLHRGALFLKRLEGSWRQQQKALLIIHKGARGHGKRHTSFFLSKSISANGGRAVGGEREGGGVHVCVPSNQRQRGPFNAPYLSSPFHTGPAQAT